MVINYFDKLKKLIKKQNGTILSSDLDKYEIPRTYLSMMVSEGKLERIDRGVYVSADSTHDGMYRKPVLPDYPPINIFRFSKKQYEIGIQEIEIDNHKIKIYDLEKTICDCLRYRNEIGLDVVKELLNQYVKRRDRNIDKLLRYADATGIYNLLNKYLEVLL